MEKNRLKAVIFDLDGVITDSAHFHFQAWKALADELNIPFDEQYNEKLKGVSRMESLELILQNSKEKIVYTLEEKEKLATKKNEYYKRLIEQITPNDTLDGILPFLKQLKENNIKIALASVSKNAPYILEKLQLTSYFEYIADPEKVEKAKPYPDIFLAGVEFFGVKQEECIGIEDAKAGIEAIHRAGMKAVGVGTRDQMEEADLIISTSELSLEVIKEKFAFE